MSNFFSRLLSQPASAASAASPQAAAPNPSSTPATGTPPPGGDVPPPGTAAAAAVPGAVSAAAPEISAADSHEQNSAIVAFNGLQHQLATANSALGVVSAERDNLAGQITALTTERDQLRAQTTRTTEQVTADVRNRELSTLAASQGIPSGQVPAAGAGAAAAEGSGFREKLDGLKDPIARAEHILAAIKPFS